MATPNQNPRKRLILTFALLAVGFLVLGFGFLLAIKLTEKPDYTGPEKLTYPEHRPYR